MRWIPDSKVMDSRFHRLKLPGFRIPDYLTWGDTDAYTSPLYIGDISVFLVYRRIYLAVVHRRHISPSYIQTYLPRRCTSVRYQSFRYIQTHIPRRCTSARYQSFLYTDAPTSPLYIGEISVFLIIQTHLPRRCTSARY